MSLCLGLLASALNAQSTPPAKPRATPAPQGSFVSDPAIPTLISPSEFRSEFFVLNKDFSLLTHSSVDSSVNGTCAAPSGFDGSSATPRTFVNDTQNAYFTGQLANDTNPAVSGFSFINTGLCEPINGPTNQGGTPGYTFASNDRYHARLYVLSGSNTSGPDTLTVEVNLNNATSGGNYVTKLATVPLDTGAQYTSLVTDTLGGANGVALTAITELKTATSPGNLWIYNQASGAAYQILGPNGVALPAVTSFIIPAQTNGGGNLLVLVNQDNLTATNIANPPLDTTPFTIIDLGQLLQTFSVQTSGGTITLPFVTQIQATTPYFAMLGAAYNPVTRLVYAVVGGGSASGVTGNVISYDPFNPGSPRETVVADISNIPFSFGAYPQLALSAAAGTLQLLTPSPSTLYSVGILGTGNTAVAVPGSTFPDASFQPTSIAANTLLGETYVASASGKVDILKNSATPLATFTLVGPDIGTTTQSYSLQGKALYAVDDDALRAAAVTITATPQGSGTAFTVAAGSLANFAGTNGNIPITFPALGVYTLVALVPATANYPAITSNPINVTVASNFIAGVYPTTLTITAPTNPATTAVNALVTLGGSTYAPTGTITVTDGTGKTVGSTTFTGGALVQPTTVAVTLSEGSNTLTASYDGDAQNAPSTSSPLTVSVGTQVTPTLALTVASPATVGNSVAGNVKLTATTTTAPTGSVTIYGMVPGTTTPLTLATVTAAQAFTPSGANYSFKAPAAGTYQVSATYPGDSNYAAATSANTSLLVNAAAAVDTTLTVTAPASATTDLVFKINIKLASATSTQTPTGNINVTAQLAGSTNSTNIGMIDPAQAYATAGTNLTAQFSTAGVWTINASYLGDQNFKPSTGNAMLTVSPATVDATTLKITAPANVAVNTPYTAVIKLTAASSLTNGPSGLVTLVVTSSTGAIVSTINTTAASAFLGSSGYSASIPAATASGTYTLTASFAGDSNYSASSTTSTVTAGSTLSTTTLGISGSTNATINVGSSVTIRLAAQKGATATPTGNVTIMTTNPSGVTATIGTITAAQALASGGDVADIKYTALGNFTVTVTYAGDANFSGSTANFVVTVANAVVSPTTLGLNGPTSVKPGDSFSITALLKATGTSTAPITGIVTLVAQGTANTYNLGALSAVQAFTSGGAVFSANIPSAGVYTVSAVYPGDANYAKSSGTLVLAVSSGQTKTALVLTYDNGQVAPAKPFRVNVMLSPSAASTVPITGKIGLTAVPQSTSAPVVQLGSVDALAATNLAGVSTMVQFPAGLSGTYMLTATYPGDPFYAASSMSGVIGVTGGAVALTLTGPGTAVAGVPVQLLVVANFPVYDALPPAIIITSTVNGAAGPQTTTPGNAASVLPGTTVPLVFPNAGTYLVTANIPGDPTNAAGTSTTLKVVVSAPAQGGFTMVANTVSDRAALSVSAAQDHPTTDLTLTAIGGFNSPVTFTLAPTMSTQIKFAVLDASGKKITTATPSSTGLPITIQASAPSYISLNSLPAGPDRRPLFFGGGLLCLMLSGLRLRGEQAKRILSLLGCVMIIGLFGSLLSACGSNLDKMDLVVTATPTTASPGVTAQTLTLHVEYTKNLE